jgi:1-acyl-sn-glycerol-3-phosphate acyltransferase
VFLGIYFFDYQIDQIINRPLVIVGSVLGGFVVTFLVIIVFLESTYFVIAKRYPATSKLKHFFGKQIVAVPMHLSRIKTTVVGKEHLPQQAPFLIYSNHTSELDISILMCYLREYPVAFLAKDAVRRYLSVGKWAESIGCVMLNRDNNRQGNEAISQVISNLKNGLVMVVFPEGTFERKVALELLKFRSGAFKIALSSGVPVVPITIVKEPTFYDKKWPRSKRMDLVIHPPLSYDRYKEESSRQLGLRIRTIIESGLQKKKT